MKVFTFTDDSYWASNGCDCCEEILMPSYNCDQVSGNFGSAHSEEDCYLHSIATTLGYWYYEDIPSEYREMDYDELKFFAENMGLKVEIVS